jgi:hypothetical protein
MSSSQRRIQSVRYFNMQMHISIIGSCIRSIDQFFSNRCVSSSIARMLNNRAMIDRHRSLAMLEYRFVTTDDQSLGGLGIGFGG